MASLVCRHTRVSLLAGLPIAAALLVAVVAAPGQMPREMSAVAWKDDLRFLATELPRKHKNVYHTLTRDAFARAVAELESRIVTLPADAVVLELKKLIAMVGDGHTRLRLAQPRLDFRSVPITVFAYPEGLYIVQTTPQYVPALGCRIVGIGSRSIDEVLTALGPLVSGDNAMSARNEAVALMRMPKVLREIGLIADDRSVPFRLEDADGRTFTVELRADTPLDASTAINMWDESGAPPLKWEANRKNYWFRYLEASRTLYMQYNLVSNEPEKPFEMFCREFFQFADSHSVERFVVDLRNNIGGNGNLTKPLIDGFKARNVFARPDRLFVIIGRRTFSAGLMAAIDLKHGRFFREPRDPRGTPATETILVGEPTGGKPNSYSELGELTLPKSKIVVTYSKLFWELAPELGDTPSLSPDIPVAPSVSDDRAGRDSAMERILTYRSRRQD